MIKGPTLNENSKEPFKVGDWVVRKPEFRNKQWKFDDIPSEVVGVRFDTIELKDRIILSCADYYWWKADNFTLTEKPKTVPFKVGDWVVRNLEKQNDAWSWGDQPSEVTKVRSVTNSCDIIILKDRSPGRANFYWWGADNFTLTEKPKTESRDIVEMIKNIKNKALECADEATKVEDMLLKGDYLPPQQKPKTVPFKVGDWVVRNSRDQRGAWKWGDQPSEVIHIREVRDINETSIYLKDRNSYGTSCWWSVDHFTRVIFTVTPVPDRM